MKKYSSFFILVVLAVSSCRLTDRLDRSVYRPTVSQAGKSVQSNVDLRQRTARYKMEEKITGVATDQIRTRDESTGEDVVTVALQEVRVTARSKNVPERFGKVNLDFIVTVPKTLLDKRWMVTLTPHVRKAAEILDLEDLLINGEIYKIYQEQGASLYATLENRYSFFKRDTTHIKEYFYQKYNLSKLRRDMRLDTITESGRDFNYFYTQEVDADEGKSMNLYLSGEVFALDKSTYELPASDTVTYYVSSMAQFVDGAPRYVRRVVERQVQENLTASVTFPVGKETVLEDIGENRRELDKVRELLHKLTWSGELVVDSITMTASASPEGAWKSNESLARRRALALKEYFSKKLDDSRGVDTLLAARWVAEDWKGVMEQIRKSTEIVHRDEILSLIASRPDPDEREAAIRRSYPKDYACMKDSIYPALRAVDFKFNLHRAGMTQDTVHTTEIDTLYDRGRELLKSRRYKEALRILAEYADDYNTAIAYLSLGYDPMAYGILKMQPETADREYLLAVLASRMGKEEEAVERYLKACRADESKVYRGALDPEINKLIIKYKLAKKINENKD